MKFPGEQDSYFFATNKYANPNGWFRRNSVTVETKKQTIRATLPLAKVPRWKKPYLCDRMHYAAGKRNMRDAAASLSHGKRHGRGAHIPAQGDRIRRHAIEILWHYFQNDPERPLVYGEVELINPPRQRLRGEPLKEGVLVHPVLVGFCGTDHELMQMGRRGQLNAKFPPGQKRLINGHEGVVWVPSENRFAIVLIRGGRQH